MSKNLSNGNSRTMKESKKTMVQNTILKLRYLVIIGALASITSCSSYTSNLSDGGLAVPTYPVVQF